MTGDSNSDDPGLSAGKSAGDLLVDYGTAQQRINDLNHQIDQYRHIGPLQPFQMKQVADLHRQKARGYRRLSQISFAYADALRAEANDV